MSDRVLRSGWCNHDDSSLPPRRRGRDGQNEIELSSAIGTMPPVPNQPYCVRGAVRDARVNKTRHATRGLVTGGDRQHGPKLPVLARVWSLG